MKNQNRPLNHKVLKTYLRGMKRVAPLTAKRNARLLAQAGLGDLAARAALVRANLGKVVAVANQYTGLGLPLLDLINEGNLGLLKAIKHNDANSELWIRQAIKRRLAAFHHNRLAAVANGFPVSYQFRGSEREVAKQIEQATPPPLSKALGESLNKMLQQSKQA